MRHLRSLMRLIRLVNLLYLAAAQFLVQYTIIRPILAQSHVEPTLDLFHFSVLVISTLFIAAAGYIINDYFDVKVDALNKPSHILIDRTIPRREAILLHLVLSGIGIVMAFWIAWHASNIKLGFIHILVALLLWFYSTNYKRNGLAGNFIIAFLSSLVIILPALYDRQLFYPANELIRRAASTILIILFFYFILLFMLAFMRELVKDVLNAIGDARIGSHSFPVRYGMAVSRNVIYVLQFVFLIAIVYLQQIEWRGDDFSSAIFLFATVELPMIITAYLLWKPEDQKNYLAANFIFRGIMGMALLSMVYFYYLMQGAS